MLLSALTFYSSSCETMQDTLLSGKFPSQNPKDVKALLVLSVLEEPCNRFGLYVVLKIDLKTSQPVIELVDLDSKVFLFDDFFDKTFVKTNLLSKLQKDSHYVRNKVSISIDFFEGFSKIFVFFVRLGLSQLGCRNTPFLIFSLKVFILRERAFLSLFSFGNHLCVWIRPHGLRRRQVYRTCIRHIRRSWQFAQILKVSIVAYCHVGVKVKIGVWDSILHLFTIEALGVLSNYYKVLTFEWHLNSTSAHLLQELNAEKHIMHLNKGLQTLLTSQTPAN